MKAKKIILFCFILLAGCGIGIRIHYVNIGAKRHLPKVVFYPIGKDVPFENNVSDGERTPGYTLATLESKIMTRREYDETFHIRRKEKVNPHLLGYYVVKLRAGNVDNPDLEQYGINPLTIRLAGVDYSIIGETNDIPLLNPHILSPFFSLRTGTTLDFWISYAIYQNGFSSNPLVSDFEMLKKYPPYIMMTQFPEQKLLATVKEG